MLQNEMSGDDATIPDLVFINFNEDVDHFLNVTKKSQVGYCITIPEFKKGIFMEIHLGAWQSFHVRRGVFACTLPRFT